MTISLLVKALGDEDINIKMPAAQAISNLLALDNEPIVDKLLFSGIVDLMFKWAASDDASGQVVNEVTYAFSNIVGGTLHHIDTFL